MNIFKRNDAHNMGNYHKCFLDLERTMCAPAFKISKLWWTAVLPCFLAPLPRKECPIHQGRSWRFPGIISLHRSLLGHSFKHASVNNFKTRWHEWCSTVLFRGKVLKRTNGKFLAHYKIVLSSKFRKPKPVCTLICRPWKWKSAGHVLEKSWFSRGPLIWTSDCHLYESVSVLRDFLSSSIQRSQLLTHEPSSDMGKQP